MDIVIYVTAAFIGTWATHTAIGFDTPIWDVLPLAACVTCGIIVFFVGLKWLAGLGGANHDTIIVMATLKAAPTNFASNLAAFWLEGGRIVEGGRKAA